MKPKVGLLSLGCPRNLVDSEVILAQIRQKGFTLVENISESDIAIINTCSFIKEAKEESVDAILDLCQLKKEGKVKKIIVAGCLAQQYGKNLIKDLPEVDAFVGKLALSKTSKRLLLTPRHYAYLKIAEGCDNQCSYCVIPKIKGRFKSRQPKDIIAEVELLESLKYIKELNIIGQDITSYGIDLKQGLSLSGLIKKIILKTKNIRWFRLLYLHPNHIDNKLIDLIKNEPRICKYIDLPIQHISGRILKAMNRKITPAGIRSLINKIRKEIPEVVIRTSIIVGFPGETEEEFKELLGFLKETCFERLGAFIYSREEKTPAYNFKNQISEKIKQERFDAVMTLQQKIAYEFNQSLLEKELDLLIDEKSEDNNFYLGRTYMDAPEVDGEVFVKGNMLIGDLTKVKIIDAYEYDLVAELI